MYKLKNISEKNLINQGFRQITDGWVLHFPVYFYNKSPILFCEAIIYPEESSNIFIDVRRVNGSPHHQWYQNNQQAQSIIDEINKNIRLKMKKIGAIFYDN